MEAKEVAAEIRSCRRDRRGRQSFDADALGLDEAYRIQTELAQEREQNGDPIVGYKLGLISAAKQGQMNVSEPIIGHLHLSMVANPGESVARGRFIQPRVEPEFGVVFDRDVEPGASAGDLTDAITFAVLAVDVLDSIYAGYKFTAFDVVADNASGGAIVLGSRPLLPEVLWRREGHLKLDLDGGDWVEGPVSGLGSPQQRIAWAVERVSAFSRGIRRGDVLLLGAPCAATLVGGAQMLVAEGPEGSRLVSKFV